MSFDGELAAGERLQGGGAQPQLQQDPTHRAPDAGFDPARAGFNGWAWSARRSGRSQITRQHAPTGSTADVCFASRGVAEPAIALSPDALVRRGFGVAESGLATGTHGSSCATAALRPFRLECA
ncbi:MAG: hypothetical protein ACYDHH_29715 [Solirubrobacteraceae bacterium]